MVNEKCILQTKVKADTSFWGYKNIVPEGAPRLSFHEDHLFLYKPAGIFFALISPSYQKPDCSLPGALEFPGTDYPGFAHKKSAGRFAARHFPIKKGLLITVMLRLKRTFLGNTQISGLRIGKHIQLYTDLGQVQAGYLFVKVLGQYIYFVLVLIAMLPQF